MGEKNINERVPSSFPFTRFWGKTVLWVSLVQGYIECAIVFAIQYILWAFSQCSALLCDFVCSFLHLYRMCMHMWIILIKALHTSIPSPKKLFLLQGRHFISVHGIFNCNKFCPWKASSGFVHVAVAWAFNHTVKGIKDYTERIILPNKTSVFRNSTSIFIPNF